MADELAARHCKPCEGGVAPLTREQSEELLTALHADWSLSDDGLSISRRFAFTGYDKTLGFADAVAWIAISQDHHPVLTVAYGHCTDASTTHAINGLSDNDFLCAARIDRLVETASS